IEHADGRTDSADVDVYLDQTSRANFTLEAGENVLTIVGTSAVREGNSSLTNAMNFDDINKLPVGQEYRDLLKLIPGVQYSENGVLGPSAGGSGRDNIYGFDGIDVSLPMFGNLASEPSTHDIENVSIDKGGAKAIGFNRSGGFAINTTSKTGTDEWKGNLEYKFQNKDFVADRKFTDRLKNELETTWLTANVRGPLIEDTLFFYGSYYNPEIERVNKETAYGPVKDYYRNREEVFGKFTYAPTDSLMLNLSLRTSDNDARGQAIGAFDADSVSYSDDFYQDIFTLDGSWIISDYTTLSIKYAEYDYETFSNPDTLFNTSPSIGDALDLNNLTQLGRFTVPELYTGAPTATFSQADIDLHNAIAQTLINQYGYIDANGNRAGGGHIGGYHTINDQSFYRDTFEIKFDHEMDIGNSKHFFHIGYQSKEGSEVLSRLSNGWGSISFVGAKQDASDGTPIFYRAIVQQMSLQGAGGATTPEITSSYETKNFEINDTIESGDFTYNIGFLMSNDIYYGQGLKVNKNNLSGFEVAEGHKYKMHEIDWSDMIQPRLGITWNYNGEDTVFANFAQYNPEVSSLARAASWARNTRATLNVDFDANGNIIETTPRAGSSGKFFQEGIKPRRIDEFVVGMTKNLDSGWFVRSHIRRREGSNFWEDTSNASRLYNDFFAADRFPFGPVPANIAAKGLYIPDLDLYRAEVGGSSYVIAQLDGAFTSYNEFNIEAEYEGEKTFFNISYTWSQYYGNFDQDNVSGTNDANLFVGSSNLADGLGRQLWDGKYGKLLGDKPHVLKASGYYTTDWNANLGAFFVFQSGDVWEKWDGTLYGYSSSTIRYAEPAGSRRSPDHWQLDLNYTQDFELSEDYIFEFRADLFNVLDNQTGYNMDPYASNSTFGQPRALYKPRRLQLSFNLKF
ncbi:MAG: carboxypeptidase regulatory-like domain-containing protein, partial [Gammaproteobacteria bacterium]|nr:carboxypeptidase regulatory-like domain-containing protein [Gammaproteobacteria bacterium]